MQIQPSLKVSNNAGILNTCTRLWLTESEQATLMGSIKDVVRISVKVPEFDKHLKKTGGHIDRNVVFNMFELIIFVLHTYFKVFSLSCYLPTAGRKLVGFIPFVEMVLELCEMPTASSRFELGSPCSILNNGNHYTTSTSKICPCIGRPLIFADEIINFC